MVIQINNLPDMAISEETAQLLSGLFDKLSVNDLDTVKTMCYVVAYLEDRLPSEKANRLLKRLYTELCEVWVFLSEDNSIQL